MAIKIVQHSVDMEDRVLREAQAAAKLNHHNIVTVYEMVREAERTLLISEYVEGQTLRQLYRAGSLGDADVAEIGLQLCRALEHAHKRGVVHRDIKPENIMLADGDDIDVRLMDFGVAQLEDRASITMTGDLIGTMGYMSPEQAECRNVDSRTDVYSLALTLYEGFVRRDPSEAKRLRGLLADVSRPSIPPLSNIRPDLPQELSDILRKAMSRDRYKRPDASSLGRMLEAATDSIPVRTRDRARPRAKEVRKSDRRERSDSFITTVLPRGVGEAIEGSRLAFMGRHLVSAGLTLCSLVYVLARVPFYPSTAIIPLIIATAFLALVWPFGGGALAIVLMAPPIFAYGVGWGVLYLIVAIVTMGLLRWKHKEWMALLPGAVPLAVGAYLGLALLPLTGALLRRWGALTGFVSGLVLAIAANLAGWSRLPYTFNPSPGSTLASASHVSSPLTVLGEIGRFFGSRPEMALQVGLFAIFSLPLYAWIGRTPGTRLWGMSIYLILVLVAFVLGPILIFGAPVHMGPLLIAYVPCAIITFLLSFLTPSVRGESL